MKLRGRSGCEKPSVARAREKMAKSTLNATPKIQEDKTVVILRPAFDGSVIFESFEDGCGSLLMGAGPTCCGFFPGRALWDAGFFLRRWVRI